MQCISLAERGNVKMPRKRSSQGKRLAVPLPSVIRMQADLEPNVNHPLGALASGPRNEQRQHVLGSILARLAVGPSTHEASRPMGPDSPDTTKPDTDKNSSMVETAQ